MKASLDWLKEFIPVHYSTRELAERLTMSGLEVEHIEGEGDAAVFTLGITPNRGDCLSILGLAREVSVLQEKRFVFKPKTPSKGEQAIKDFLSVKVLDAKGCPRYMARVIKGVKIGSSPEWMQKKLKAAGLRPINNVVDCTNYVMWELGQPLHAFDYRFLRGKQIIVRTESQSFKFTTLDGVERACTPTDLFICDGEGPVALAGVMGGANSEVCDDTDTLVLESACFDPRRIHATSKRLQLKSESSRRFERGVDPNNVANALHRVTELIVETAGGVPSKDWIDIYPKKAVPAKMTLPFFEVERILGLKLKPILIQKILDSLGFDSKVGKGGLNITVPTFRPDVSRTIDLVEEVARLHHYDNIPTTLPEIKMNLPIQPEKISAKKITTECWIGLGYTECCHLSFISPKKIAPFTRSRIPREESGSSCDPLWITLSNPLSEDHLCMRPTLIPSLLDAVAFNWNRQRKDIKLFELGKIFYQEKGVSEKVKLGVVACGNEWPLQWALPSKPTDFFSLKGGLNRLAELLHLKPLNFVKESFDFLVSTTSCKIELEGEPIGWLGLIEPSVLKIWEIDTTVYALEIEWEALAKVSKEGSIRYRPISKYPFIERDIAVVVDNSLTCQKVEEAAKSFQNSLIKKIQLFDVFRGKNIPQGKKSLAFTILYASPDRTLTSEEVNETHQSLITHLEKTIGATLRS